MFNSLRMDDAAAMLIRELIKRTGIKPDDIDEVLAGSAMPWGEDGMLGGRNIAFLAELPFSVAGQHNDRQCGSSLTTVNNGAMGIALGYSDVAISCGIEHMTHVPMGGGDIAYSKPNERLWKDPKYAKYEYPNCLNMGYTAEKLFGQTDFTREDMDKWALRSHQRAAKAHEEGFFKDEIMPVEVTLGDGTKKIIDSDQAVRPDTALESLMQLRPAYTADGNITAGNSSPLNAGATALVIMSKEGAKERGLKPLATVVSMGWAGVDPSIMGVGPVPASRKALNHAGLDVKDIDFWEINEAFSIVTLNAMKELGVDPEKVNIKGGAVAIGHPLGASGTRLAGTLARILNLEGGTYGVATLCCGGGQGVATILKKEDY